MNAPWTLVAVALATFMTYLDNNIVNVAIPVIQRDLELSTAGIEWVVSGYILVFASLLLAGGRLADVYGRRRLFADRPHRSSRRRRSLAGLRRQRRRADRGTCRPGPRRGAAHADDAGDHLRHLPDPRERNAAVGVWSGVGALALARRPAAWWAHQ